MVFFWLDVGLLALVVKILYLSNAENWHILAGLQCALRWALWLGIQNALPTLAFSDCPIIAPIARAPSTLNNWKAKRFLALITLQMALINLINLRFVHQACTKTPWCHYSNYQAKYVPILNTHLFITHLTILAGHVWARAKDCKFALRFAECGAVCPPPCWCGSGRGGDRTPFRRSPFSSIFPRKSECLLVQLWHFFWWFSRVR